MQNCQFIDIIGKLPSDAEICVIGKATSMIPQDFIPINTQVRKVVYDEENHRIDLYI